jgi:hypothetical protein
MPSPGVSSDPPPLVAPLKQSPIKFSPFDQHHYQRLIRAREVTDQCVVWSGGTVVHLSRGFDRRIEEHSGVVYGNAFVQKISSFYCPAVDDRGFICFYRRASAGLRHLPKLITQMGFSLTNVVACT